MKSIFPFVLSCALVTPAWALKPSAGKAEVTVTIMKYPNANSSGPYPSEKVCERRTDLPVLDLRNQKKAQLIYTIGDVCKTNIGGEPATVSLDFASALIMSEIDGAPTKVVSSVINVSVDSTGNYFRLGSSYVETSDLDAKDLRTKTGEQAYLLPDLPKNKEAWTAETKVEFTAN